jgi:hypothetical protein
MYFPPPSAFTNVHQERPRNTAVETASRSQAPRSSPNSGRKSVLSPTFSARAESPPTLGWETA